MKLNLENLRHPAQWIFPAKLLPEAKRWQLVAFGFLMARIAGYLEPTVKRAAMGLWQITVTHPLELLDWRAFGLVSYLATIALVAYIAYDISQWFGTELRRR